MLCCVQISKSDQAGSWQQISHVCGISYQNSCAALCMCCSGPWAPLKYILEGEIAPYGVLAMSACALLFASLTEWPGQMTQVGSNMHRLCCACSSCVVCNTASMP
jgi:hypothetical protein